MDTEVETYLYSSLASRVCNGVESIAEVEAKTHRDSSSVSSVSSVVASLIGR